MAVADGKLLIYYRLKCVPPTPRSIHGCCRKGKEEYQLSRTSQPGGMVAVVITGPTISASEIAPGAAAAPLSGLGMKC